MLSYRERKERIAKEESFNKNKRAKYTKLKRQVLTEINTSGIQSMKYKLEYLTENPKAVIDTDMVRTEALECMQDAIDHYLNKIS